MSAFVPGMTLHHLGRRHNLRLQDMALATLNYSRLCHNYSIYSGINREVNKDVNKKEVYILIFQYFEVRHVNSAMTYRAHFF